MTSAAGQGMTGAMCRLALVLSLLLLPACADPALDAGVTVGTGDDGGGEISLSF